MDDEEQSRNRGAYENMAGPEIAPDFDADTEGKNDQSSNRPSITNSARNFNSAQNTLRAGEKTAEKVGEKALETGLNAATGGVAGTALKAAEKTGLASSIKPGTILKGKGALKKTLPLLLIITIIIILGAVLSFAGQSLFAIAFSRRIKQDWNATTTVNNVITDNQINNTQLAENDTSEYGDLVFNDLGFTDEQINSFNQAGLEFEEGDDGSKALVHYNVDGTKTYIVADSAISGIKTTDGDVATNTTVVGDSGSSDNSEEERIQKLIADLDVEEDAKIMKFSEALKDRSIKREYMTGTNSYRGDMSGWFNEITETVVTRLGISRNNWSSFTLSPDNDKNEQAVLDKASEIPSASSSSDVKSLSYSEMVENIQEESENEGCGTSSAFTVIESVATADQTARQVSASSLWMESIDKTVAGKGEAAPLNATTNIVVKSGGADSMGIRNLFGSEQLDQSSSDIQSISAQANGSKTGGTIDLTAIGEGNEEVYQTCIYEGNLTEHEGKGIIAKVGSMFKSIGGWIKNRASDIASFFKRVFFGVTNSGITAVASALDPTIAKYNQMKDQTYLSGNDTKLLGDAMVAGSERIMNEKSQSGGMTVGDTGAVKTAYRMQQEVIAEQAEYERETRGQFDPTSEHTFLGKIAYSLIPFATSSSALSLTSTVSSFGNLISKSVSSLLPTSHAVSETELQISNGDCVLSNSVGGFSNAYCNDYQTFDVSLAGQSANSIFEKVAEMRKDDGGYVYGITESEKTHSKMDNPRSNTSAPDYGKGPLNDAENDAELHWPLKGEYGEGTPNGCESDWEYEMRTLTDANGNIVLDANGNPVTVQYYFWDYPTEWKYSRLTNFEYEGYKTGWPNRTTESTAEREGAKNDQDPGACMLDLKTDDEKQPVVNPNGALMTFAMLSGQRASEWGTSDYTNATFLAKSDFIKGRLHPCLVNATSECDYYKDYYVWSSDPDENISSKFLSRWIGGSSYVNYTGDTAMMNIGFKNNKIFKDPSRDNDFLWNETKIYQAYIEILEWLESIGKINSSSSYKAVAKYYEENPLDNSYEGIIARYSGLSKKQVIAVLDLIEYSEFLASYNPSDLYPLPTPEETTLQYDNSEIVAHLEKAIQSAAVVYDELRNRAVAA